MPICNHCRLASRYCERPPAVRFRDAERRLKNKTSRVPSTSREQSDVADPSDPRLTLRTDPDAARLFKHYLTTLAPWYDLSDADQHFARIAARHALTSPLLFSAVIAFAAIHLHCTTTTSSSSAAAGSGGTRATAERYHTASVQHLLQLQPGDVAITDGVALAAVCLLRSYEILAEGASGRADPNRHLTGAYALADAQTVPSFGVPSLRRAGFFNYLREDITYGLMQRCPLKIENTKLCEVYRPMTDEDQLNCVTLVLAEVLNCCFERESPLEAEHADRLLQKLNALKESWAADFEPYHDSRETDADGALFGHIHMLADSHVAIQQYHLVAESVLLQARGNDSSHVRDELEHNAREVCALAFTSSTAPVIVNSFGPISFVGRFLRTKALQEELVRRLQSYRKQTGWPIQRLVGDLQACWEEEEN